MTTLRLETGGDLLRRIDSLLRSVAEEYKLRFDEDGLSVAAVDPSNVGMVSFEVPASGFETYDLSEWGEGPVIGLNRTDLSRIARFARKGSGNDDHGDPVTILYEDDTGRWNVRVERDDLDRFSSFASIDPDAIRKEPDLPDLSLPWELSLGVNAFRNMANSLKQDTYEHVEVAARDPETGVSGDPTATPRFYSLGDGDREEVFYPDGVAQATGASDPKPVESLFSLNYVREFADAIHGAGTDCLRLEFGDEFPLKLHFSESDYGLSGAFMLAPRIRGEDHSGREEPSVTADMFEDDGDDEDGDDSAAEADEAETEVET